MEYGVQENVSICSWGRDELSEPFAWAKEKISLSKREALGQNLDSVENILLLELRVHISACDSMCKHHKMKYQSLVEQTF